MTAKQTAATYFNRITSGHKNAVKRPERINRFMETVDRHLREMVEEANCNGDCIINAGFGYFRPTPLNTVDAHYYKQYKATGRSRIDELVFKEAAMDVTYENWQKEAMAAMGL